MLVFAALSSMKTSFDGVSLGCCSRHSLRALATSSRACSAAWRDFFKSQIKRGQRLVDQACAGRNLVPLQQPSAQFGDRRIGTAAPLRLDRPIQPTQLGYHMATL